MNALMPLDAYEENIKNLKKKSDTMNALIPLADICPLIAILDNALDFYNIKQLLSQRLTLYYNPLRKLKNDINQGMHVFNLFFSL